MRLFLLAFLLVACGGEEPPERVADGVEYPAIKPVWQVDYQDGTLIEDAAGKPESQRFGQRGSLLLTLKAHHGGRLEGTVESKGAIALKGEVSGLLQSQEQGFGGQIANPDLLIRFQRRNGQMILSQTTAGVRRRIFAPVKIRHLAAVPSPR